MKKLLLLLALSGCVAAGHAQEILLGTDFKMYFDNKEFGSNEFAVPGLDIESGTDFAARLTPRVGIRWDEKNTLVIAADMIKNFGTQESAYLSEIKPVFYYQFQTPKVTAAAGIFTRDMMHDDYSTAFFSESERFFHNRMNGALAQYNGKRDSYVEFVCDWEGMYSTLSREKFRILLAGRHYLDTFYYGFNYSMFHYAGQQGAPIENVVDLQLLNPCVGVRFNAFFDFDIKLGALLTAQRDRSFGHSWEKPCMGEFAFRISRWGLSLDERLYVGDNITLPNSAIILYSTTEFTRDNSAKYPVGKKVTLDLSAAQYAPYGNLRELKNVVVTVSDDPAVEVAVPTLSAATLNEGNYQGQYVRVTNLTPQSSFVGEAWATSAKRVVRFDAAGGETVQSYMATATDAAGFAAITIADKTGALLGTAEQNFKNIQVIPTTPSDVAAFVASGASLGISPEDNLVLASTSGATATVTVTANIAWTATMSGDGFTISPQGGDNNGTVTVTATAANETSASKDLGSITFSGEGVTPLTLRVAQAAKPSAEPKTVPSSRGWLLLRAPRLRSESGRDRPFRDISPPTTRAATFTR